MRFKLRQICFIFILFLFVVPVSASAVYYGTEADCKENVEPKGTFLYPIGVDKDTLRVIVDPNFNEKMKRERFTPDLPVTPFYDLIVRAVPIFGTCYTDTPERFPIQQPQILPFKVFIEDSFLQPLTLMPSMKQYIKVGDEVVVGPGILEWQGEIDALGNPVYEWKLKGWPRGITADSSKLASILNAIGVEHPLSIVVEVKKKDGTVERVEQGVSFSACAPIWGTGPLKIIGMYAGSNTIPLPERVSHFDNVRLGGFQSIQPMAAERYKGYFSYFVDFYQIIADTLNPSLAIANQRYLDSNTPRLPYTAKIHNKGLLTIVEKASCGASGVHFVTTDKEYDNGIAMAHDSAGRMGAVVGGAQPPHTYVHEWGHTFAELGDAYTYGRLATARDAKNFPLPLTNCSFNPPFDYKYNNRMYGGLNYRGCSFEITFPTIVAEQRKIFYRPSYASLMGEPMGVARLKQFDVVSCGYILSAIKGGDAHSYFPECAQMNGIIKDGVTAQMRLPQLFAWFSNLLSSPTLLTAQVGSSDTAVSSSSNSPSYLIVESFDPNDQWGEIVEIVPDALPTDSIVPGTVVIDPIDEIFAGFDSASFPIFDPEFFDEMAQEIAASGEPELSLWQRFLNFFWPDDTPVPASEEQNLPPPPLVSTPVLHGANGIPIGASGNVASGHVTIRGVITAPMDISFSKVTSTFQYAPGGGVFVDWVSFTLPTGLKAGEKATDSYTWQAGVGNWRFRLCMDSDNGRACGEELSVLVQGSVSSAPLPSSVVGPRLVPHAPLWSGRQTGKAGELYAGPMTLRAEVQNTGDAAADAVNGRFEYSQNGTTFTPWIIFSVPSLSPEAKTSASYSWQGGTGIFYMRSCVGVATCSSPVKAEIISAGS